MRLIHLVISFGFLMLLGGCQSLSGNSPEMAAVEAVLEQGQPDSPVDAQSVRALQSQQWRDKLLVVVVYQLVPANQLRSHCLDLYEVSKSPERWIVSGGSGACWLGGGLRDPLDNSAFAQNSRGDQALSELAGMVNDSAIVLVEVVWEDGEAQQVEVFNSSYLTARTGLHEPIKVRGLDQDGKLIFTQTP